MQAVARSLAMNPRNKARGPIFPESLSDFKASFQLFHGAGGVVPLARCERPLSEVDEEMAPLGLGCSLGVQARPNQPAVADVARDSVAAPHPGCSTGSLLEGAPFASLSTRVFRFLVSTFAPLVVQNRQCRITVVIFSSK